MAKSKVVIVTDYKGLDVAMINDLRKKLRASEIEFKV
ncbi:MAG: 50S ribosomal protein L10, partial [Desulfobacterales bacterium]|nr:50S ribosomal protein L10 [Desulfobacterales bacterium]